MIDLHTHSRASDGSLTPAELVAHAAERGLSALALTDHDSIEGNAEAAEAAGRSGIRFIPGVELDIEWKRGECHLLGLGLVRPSASLATLLEGQVAERNARNAEIADRMRADGIDVDLGRVTALSGGAVVGRPHFAEYLVSIKKVKNRQQAFDRYLAKGRPYFVDRTGIPLDSGIAAIRDSGGVPILAHPLSLYVSWGKIGEIIRDFAARGVAGLEAWHPAARIVECERLERLAGELGLCVTAGSDFHGAARPDRKLGRTAGRRDIDDRFLNDSLSALLAASAASLP